MSCIDGTSTERRIYITATTIASAGVASSNNNLLKLASELLNAYNAVSEIKHRGGVVNLTVNIKLHLTVDELKKTIADIISVMEAGLDQYMPGPQAVWNVTLGKLREYVSTT
uniref:Uncharacterized protein n=1 Tax=viral metagenome TaxID=1070528 RepID=A0A6C0F4Z6_9ZZZZ